MADTTLRYEPRNYRRVCDICGMLRNISEMHRQDELWVCTYDAGERVRTELDRGNANQRPFTIKPVPYPKPQNDQYPNLLETDDAAVFNFLAQQVAARCRYETVESGSAVYTAGGGTLPTMGWAARYFYDLIQENDQSRRLLIPQAKTLLGTIADYVLTRQTGGTRASSAYYGGFLASGATKYVTNDTASCGLALLYAYRVLGGISYRDGARAAASYLRNVQAIGSNASQYTSRNANGTGRLYTGAVCSEVSTIFGGDPTERFYSSHLFYPADLLVLEFWNELKLTDGDQSIGATAAVDGFDSTPAQLLSQSITDMRSCWETGIQDSTGTVINGLSTTTPREFFNAYPATKVGFSSITGTGRWEFVDGGASTGTQVSAQNFAGALSALYNYEGASSQVTGISDWLRSFTSNADFETPANTSTTALYQGTTGTYDPTIAISTLLQVRDPDTLADTKINASSLYDWGAFGLLSRLWASRNKGSFMISRLYPLNTVQRFFAGNTTDVSTDRVILRGESGLTRQTGFRIDLNASPFNATAFSGSSSAPTPSMNGLVFWVTGSSGLESSGGVATAWRDQGPLHQDLDTTDGNGPSVGLDTINGIPAVTFPLGSNSKYIRSTATMKDRNGNAFTAATERTVFALFLPKVGNPGTVRTGGPVFEFRETPMFQCLFDLESTFHANGFYWFDNAWPFSGASLLGPDTTQAIYASKNTMAMWAGAASAGATVTAAVNGTAVALTPTTSTGLVGAPPPAGFVLGNADNNTGTIQTNFQGAIAVVLVYDWIVTGADLAQTLTYLSTAGGLGVTNLAMVNDAVRASQFGRSFREART